MPESRPPAGPSDSPIERAYPYRPGWTAIVLCTLFFGALAAFMAHVARSNDRGLVINGVVTLSPGGATAFYWTVAGVGACFVLLAGLLAVVRLTSRQRVALAPAALLVPRGRWSNEETAIRFAEVLELSRTEVQGQHFLKIVHPGGTFTLVASMLPSREDFESVCAAVEERTGTAGELRSPRGEEAEE